MSRRLAAGLALLAVGLSLAACSGLKVGHDYDPSADYSGYRSFDFFPGGKELSGNPHLDTPFVEARIRESIVSTLTSRGYQKVEDRTPDFYVNYHLSVQQKLSSSNVNVHYGVGSYGSWGGVGIGTSTAPRVRQYEEGTLVIDLIDGASRKMVWRGTGSGALDRDPTPEETTRGVSNAVTKILDQFPPERK